DRRLRLLRNFGIASESDVELIGMNGKLSEVHAAMGIAMLGMIEGEIAQREGVASAYIAGLEGVDGIRIVAGNAQSMQYFVVRVDPDAFGSDRDSLFDTLRSMNVVARKYFSPLCSDMEPYSALPSAQNLPIARAVASQVLALPFYGGMSTDDATRITDIVKWHHDGNRR
ncbi:MAG: DegT/DnrJ/EryC1/StrS family aminotransferase, partial [Pseudolysinimonas sp.]